MKCINKRVLAGLLVVCVFVSVTGCGKAKSVVENGYPVYGESSSVNVLSGAEDTVSSYLVPIYVLAELKISGRNP